ncbi:MAG: hypothetical protein ABJL99_11910 [Aliishimia sp.]
MSRTKEIATAVGALACALGIGFVMQSTETASQRYGTSSERGTVQTPSQPALKPQAQIKIDMSQQQQKIVDVQDVTLTSALSSFPVHPKALPSIFVTAAAAEEVKPEIVEQTCDISAAAAPAIAATVSLVLSAPCHASERVTVHHNGMFFTDQTSPSGSLALTVPGLAKKAVYIFAFSDGKGAIAQTAVSDLETYKRVVLQWRGTAGFELHAREFGAEYGSTGHVWRNAEAMDLDLLTQGKNGYLHSLGRLDIEEPHIAEIYTFPATISGRNGHVDLSIEAEITASNCGLEIEAQTLEFDAVSGLHTQDLTLAMPSCDTIGDYLVLNNVLEDMKVAAR